MVLFLIENHYPKIAKLLIYIFKENDENLESEFQSNN